VKKDEKNVEEIDVLLHQAQYDFYWDDSFASLFIGGVGSGKTYVGARKALYKAIYHPKTLGLIAANTHTQLNQSTLVELWDGLAQMGFYEGDDYVVNKRPPDRWKIKSRFSRHNGVVTLKTGAQIVTRSLYNWRPILGLTLGWAWIDEARDADRRAFLAVLSRLRCKKTKMRQLFITTTPNGFNWLYDFFEAEPAKEKKLGKLRKYFIAKTIDNASNLPEEYLKVLLSSYDKDMARQELEGQWIDIFSGRAYYAFDRAVHISETAVFDKTLPIYLCCDFNVSPMTWIIAQAKKGGAVNNGVSFQGEVLVVIDQVVLNTSSTQEALEEFLSRGYDPKSTVVFGDAAGHHSTTISDYVILQNGGLKDIRVSKANPPVLDRVAAVNGKLKNANGEIGIFVNPRCDALVEDLSRVGFKPGTRRLDKSDPKLTHASDALGYCVNRLWPIKGSGKIKVAGQRY